jgi:YrbI family 3-deoxy-D-manno-octulosonate 8-phosphate phosphatase
MHVVKNGPVQLGIISSGFTEHMVQDRASLLGIDRVYVGRDAKLDVLNEWCLELGISLNEVGIIGDDVNDLPVMKAVGLAVCPSSAVNSVKSECHIILSRKGGDACVREFIDHYLLPQAI